MLSERVNCREALESDIVNRVAPDAEARVRNGVLRREAGTHGRPRRCATSRKTYTPPWTVHWSAALDKEPSTTSSCMRHSEDAKEVMQAFSEKRDAIFRGV